MKKTVLTVFLCACLCAIAYAQTTPLATASIKGVVIDSVKNQPIGYVTVALVDVQTNQPVKSTFTKDNGSFELSNLTAKPYKLTLVYVGYVTKTIEVANPDKPTDLGRLLLAPSNNQLKEVSITSVKPLMKREVDRITYDVQADPENKVITVLDMLRRVPLISVDAMDNIKLQGNGNYKILINGKPSALIARNPADIFRAMPASNIQKIEVITTPPAKYDAEGLAGIINIITKKDIDQGYNGSINTRYSNVYGPGGNLNLTVKQGKFGLGGYAGIDRQNRLSTTLSNVNDNFGLSYLTQEGSRTRQGDNTYANTELSYEGDSLNLLTSTIEYYKGNYGSDNNQFTNLQSSVIPGLSYRSLNNSNSGYSGLGTGINYQLGFKRSKEQLLTVSYKFNSSTNKQFNDVLFQERVNYRTPDYQQYNNSGSREHTLQLDYVQPIKKLNIEAGTKAIFRNNYSDYSTDTLMAGGLYATDPRQSYNFDYQQNVYSLYNSYQLKLTKWVVKGGLRLEHTTVNANGNVQGRPYSNFIPSFSVQRSFKSSSLNLGYTDRIQRPGIWELNPFINSQNANFLNTGNPDLRAVVSHSIELNYSNFKKGSFTLGLNYKFANNTIENVTSSNGANGVSISTYQNVGKSKRLGTDLNLNYPFTTKFNVNINGQLLHVWLRGAYNNEFYNTRGFQGSVFGNGSYKFDNGYRLGVSVDYASRYVMLQGRDNFYLGYSASTSKEFLNKKATVSVFVSNPFNKFRQIDYYSRTPDFYQKTAFNDYARRINISFNYKFGKLSGDIKKNKRGISNDDVSGGRRN